jgi:vacuolar-type H+-ATPase subunit E/Vma4
MNLGERREALLRLVEDYREQECRRILASAQDEASELRRRAFAKQRAYLHSRVLAERSRIRDSIQGARAERATRQRWTSERRSLELLDSAWSLVRERLLARWREPEQRRRWTSACLHQALDLLPHGPWIVRHAPQWSDDENRDALMELTDVLGQAPSFRSESDMAAGLIVESGNALLDASLEGLLRDRKRLEARLLVLLAERGGS